MLRVMAARLAWLCSGVDDGAPFRGEALSPRRVKPSRGRSSSCRGPSRASARAARAAGVVWRVAGAAGRDRRTGACGARWTGRGRGGAAGSTRTYETAASCWLFICALSRLLRRASPRASCFWPAACFFCWPRRPTSTSRRTRSSPSGSSPPGHFPRPWRRLLRPEFAFMSAALACDVVGELVASIIWRDSRAPILARCVT